MQTNTAHTTQSTPQAQLTFPPGRITMPSETISCDDWVVVSAAVFNLKNSSVDGARFVSAILEAGGRVAFVVFSDKPVEESIKTFAAAYGSERVALISAGKRIEWLSESPTQWVRDAMGMFSQGTDGEYTYHLCQRQAVGKRYTSDVLSGAWRGAAKPLPGAFQGGQVVSLPGGRAVVARVAKAESLGQPDISWVDTPDFKGFLEENGAQSLSYISVPTVRTFDRVSKTIANFSMHAHADMFVACVGETVLAARLHESYRDDPHAESWKHVDTVLAANAQMLRESFTVVHEVRCPTPTLHSYVYDMIDDEIPVYSRGVRFFSPLNLISLAGKAGSIVIAPSIRERARADQSNCTSVAEECCGDLTRALEQVQSVEKIVFIPCAADGSGFLRCSTNVIPDRAILGFETVVE